MTGLVPQADGGPLRIVGAAVADRRPPRPVPHHLRDSCPVCGHPTTDCTHDTTPSEGSLMAENGTARERASEKNQDVDKAAGDSKTGGEKAAARTAAEVKAAMVAEPLEVVNGDAVLVSPGEDGDGSALFEDAATASTVVLKQDVIERFFYPGTKRPAFRQLYVKGQVVSRAVLEEKLAALRAAGSTIESPEAAAAARVDASTLASGTYPGVAATVSQEQSPQGTSETK